MNFRITIKALITVAFAISLLSNTSVFAGVNNPTLSASSVPSQADQPAIMAGDYIIAPLDQLEIRVQGHDELHQNELVLNDGTFDFPTIGTVHASGRTVEQLQADIENGLKATCNDPQVTVLVTAAHIKRISVAGAIHTPGLYDYHPGMRLMELIAASGGLSSTPELSQAVLMTDNGTNVIPVDMVSLMTDGNQALNLPLSPGDVLLVSPRDPSAALISVLGHVRNPGQYQVMRGGATILTMLTEAGGADQSAALSQSQIMHAGQVTPVDLHPLVHNLQAPIGAIKLYGGDTLLVPENKQKVAVLGEVAQSAVYLIPDGEEMTVTTAIGQAGGVNTLADKKNVTVIRTDKTGQRHLITMNIDPMLTGNSGGTDLTLQAGDILLVPTHKHTQSPLEIINQIPGLYYISKLMGL